MSESTITGIFTIIGVVIGSVATFAIAFCTVRLEDKRHTRELGIKLALAHLEHRMKEGQAFAEAAGREIEVKPISIFVAEGIKMAEIISNPSLKPYEIGQKLAQIPAYLQAVQQGIDSKKS